MTNNFNKDLKVGQTGEKILANFILKNKWGDTVAFANTKDYDIIIKSGKYYGTTFEVKYDQYPDTGNMILEIFCLKRLIKTGILSSKAKYFCYIFTHNKTGYIIKTSILLNILSNLPKNIVTNGGDSNASVMVKLPYKKLLSKFYKFEYE